MDATDLNEQEKIELSHVLFHSKFASCLTCKKFFWLNCTNSKSDALTHVQGKNHRKIVKGVFRKCINDPFCITNDMNYLDVLKNLKLNMSPLLRDNAQITYIYERNESNLFCSICHETVSSSSIVEQIQMDLVNHLNNKFETHVSVIKNSASWIYNLNNCNGSITFHKAKVFCSLCDISLDFVDDLMLHSAVGHLQTKQHKLKVIQSNAKELIGRAELIARADGSGGQGLSALPKQDNTKDSQTVQQFVNTSFLNIDKMTLGSIRALAEDSLFAPHVLFLKIEGCNLMCTLCDVPLTISRSKINHIMMHILGSTHRKLCAEKHNIFVPDRSLYCSSDKLVCTTPLDQIQKLATEPKFAPHVKYLKVIGRTCSCLLCDITLSVSIKVNHNLKEHILGKHMKIYEKLHSGVHQGVKIVGEASSPSHIQKSDKMGLSPVSNPHIKVMGKGCYCSLCNATLLSESNIKEHVMGANHKKQCKKLKLLNKLCSKQDISQPIKLLPNSASESSQSPHIIAALRGLANDPRCAPHLEYLQFNNNIRYCSICSASVPIEKRGFLQHILGAKHKKRFEKLQIGGSHSKTISDQKIQSTQILAELKKLAQDPSCAPQLKYIKKEKNQYHCSICKVQIPSGNQNIKAHLIGAKHMKQFKSGQ